MLQLFSLINMLHTEECCRHVKLQLCNKGMPCSKPHVISISMKEKQQTLAAALQPL